MDEGAPLDVTPRRAAASIAWTTARSSAGRSSPARATAGRCSWTARCSTSKSGPRRPGAVGAVAQPPTCSRRPMPARVTAILVEPGQAVRKGDVLVKLEAMKMELAVRAPRDGTVSRGVLPGRRTGAARRRPAGDRMSGGTTVPERACRRGRAARRPAERARADRHRRQGRVHRPAVRGRTAGDRSGGVRRARSGCRRWPTRPRSLAGYRAAPGTCVLGARAEPHRASSARGGRHRRGGDLRGRVRDVQPAEHQPGDRRVAGGLRGRRRGGASGRHPRARLPVDLLRLPVRRRRRSVDASRRWPGGCSAWVSARSC